MPDWTKEEQAEHRRLWVEALESGDYKQTTGRLHDDDGYCCLGVACEISGLVTWDQPAEARHYNAIYDPETGDFSTVALPLRVAKWLGLSGLDGDFHSDTHSYILESLANINDGGASFADIAALIRTEPLGLLSKEAAE